jgi:dipeptidyl aminopeptidase/acylaminoacyl peptidase
MKNNAVALLAAAALGACIVHAQSEPIAPPASLIIDGVPPIPGDLAAQLAPYGDFRPHGMLSWHPTRREMLIRRRLNATNQVHLVTEPGTTPVALTDFPDAVPNGVFEPTRGDYFLFSRAEGGNEVFRLFREDIASKAVTPVSAEGERVSSLSFSRKGDRIVYATQPVDRSSKERSARTIVHVADPLKPAADRVIARLDGGGWFGFRFSEDGRKLVFIEYKSATQSHVWVMDIATGKKRRVTPDSAEPVYYGETHFSKNGKALFTITDRGSEFRRLAYLPLDGGKERILSERHSYDVDDYDISFDANRLAFVTNENGSDVLRFIDTATLKELPRPPLMQGVIGGLQWRPKSSEVAFQMSSARSAGDVFSYDLKTNALTRWTNGNNPQLNTSEFIEPRLIKWKSFDEREITGFHYQPPERFTGKRPVIINIHGGPEAQARPGFIGRNNYFVSELGVAMIYPNVRGSEGFGKTFLKLDDGMKREDSVRDIGALLDWIKDQPDLDATRVMITGGSYGGYMTFATSVHFADRIASSVAVVGISNFVTFLERTESYRRDLRRVEYGDERDPAMRAFLESISPLNSVERITKPLFVVAGLNDPRVPYTEAEQIVATLKKQRTPVWFLMARDEGHGFAKKPNADYQFYATVEFAKQTLLK